MNVLLRLDLQDSPPSSSFISVEIRTKIITTSLKLPCFLRRYCWRSCSERMCDTDRKRPKHPRCPEPERRRVHLSPRRQHLSRRRRLGITFAPDRSGRGESNISYWESKSLRILCSPSSWIDISQFREGPSAVRPSSCRLSSSSPSIEPEGRPPRLEALSNGLRLWASRKRPSPRDLVSADDGRTWAGFPFLVWLNGGIYGALPSTDIEVFETGRCTTSEGESVCPSWSEWLPPPCRFPHA